MVLVGGCFTHPNARVGEGGAVPKSHRPNDRFRTLAVAHQARRFSELAQSG
jgi:hypothetical protein